MNSTFFQLVAYNICYHLTAQITQLKTSNIDGTDINDRHMLSAPLDIFVNKFPIDLHT
jgi:hypothetical protein